jgi:hypothetical protein
MQWLHMQALIMDIRFPGESQQIDRILQRFAGRYFECNRSAGVYETEDTVYILSFSIMMLNTDLHSRSVNPKKRSEYASAPMLLYKHQCLTEMLTGPHSASGGVHPQQQEHQQREGPSPGAARDPLLRHQGQPPAL